MATDTWIHEFVKKINVSLLYNQKVFTGIQCVDNKNFKNANQLANANIDNSAA
jgi:hypothetical protein